MCIQMVKELVYKIYSRPMGGFFYMTIIRIAWDERN